jgi:hypothetical protein
LEVNSCSNIENFSSHGDDIAYLSSLDLGLESDPMRAYDINACILRRLGGQPRTDKDILSTCSLSNIEGFALAVLIFDMFSPSDIECVSYFSL